jgi:hypothetical protein
MRGRKPLPKWAKVLSGTLRPDRERKRQEREAEEQEKLDVARTVCRFFLAEGPTESDRSSWAWYALLYDIDGIATLTWREHHLDFKAEYTKRYPNRPWPHFWKRYESPNTDS